jgi:hypothetical protein
VKEKFGQLKQIQLEIGILVVFAEFFWCHFVNRADSRAVELKQLDIDRLFINAKTQELDERQLVFRCWLVFHRC